MNSLKELIDSLACPVHRSELKFDPESCPEEGVPWKDSQIRCIEGCVFHIAGGIPRFVPRENYASSFGLQWQRYQKTQLDSHTGHPISRQRLERCLGMPLEALQGKVVWEAGSGAGRFTELLIENCKMLVSSDLSEAVNANLKNCAGKKPYLLIQSDINKSPLPHSFFDVVICLGVVNCTPSPERTIASLAAHVKPGGLLVLDHYTHRRRFSAITDNLTLAYPIRAVLKRLHPDTGLKATIALTAICDPIRKRTVHYPWIDRFASRIFPSVCFYKYYPMFDPATVYEWNELDTHDTLTDYYQHYRSVDDIRKCLQDLGFRDIVSQLGENGVEARAVCPPRSRNASSPQPATIMSTVDSGETEHPLP